LRGIGDGPHLNGDLRGERVLTEMAIGGIGARAVAECRGGVGLATVARDEGSGGLLLEQAHAVAHEQTECAVETGIVAVAVLKLGHDGVERAVVDGCDTGDGHVSPPMTGVVWPLVSCDLAGGLLLHQYSTTSCYKCQVLQPISIDFLRHLVVQCRRRIFVRDDEEMLTVKEAAARLKLNPETIRRWIKSERIRAVSLGSDKAGYRIPSSEVQRILGGVAAHRRGDD
jgi:excisionase family DNA binding protein